MTRLSGLKVVDLSQFLPGPMLTVMMADQGATVIKVEPPAGDPARQMGPYEAGHSIWFRNLNRGKQSVTLDLKTPQGKAALWALLEDADVLLEGFRPGVMARLGFDAARVRARFPALIYCSLTAFGQSGPLAHHPAHDLGVQAESGLLALNNADSDAPVVPGVPAADIAAGLTALAAILTALYARTKSGHGATIDASMFASLLPWSAHIAGEAISGGPAPTSTHRSLGGHAFYSIYACADGQHITLCGREAKFVHTLLTALARPDLIAAALSESPVDQAQVKAVLAAIFAAHSRSHWERWFHGKDVAFAPVRSLAEALPPHVITDAQGAHHLPPAIRFTDEDWTPRTTPDRR
jgi:crotonobetainyl-CoA:carnitine CoA-transferase CaiB-like acyl-CoA transferase